MPSISWLSSPPLRIVRALAAALLFLPALSCAEREPELVLRFSAIPDQDEARLRAKFQPVARYLADRLGVPVEYVPVTEYADAVELFAHGDVQLAWFGGLTGVQARARVPGARVICMGEEDREFRSYFIAHADTGIARSDVFPMALEGRTFCFGSKLSTSGRLMPEYFIRRETGRAPEEFFRPPLFFSGSHDATVELVQNGRFEAGVVNYTVYERRVKEGTTDPEICRVVWVTPPYPDYNFTAHPVLEDWFGAGFLDRLRDALIEMRDPQLLSAFPRRGFVPGSNEDFRQLEQVARDLGFLP